MWQVLFGSSQISYLCFHSLHPERKQSLEQETYYVGVTTLKANGFQAVQSFKHIH
jgi:hypothetical protein